jgi:TRAP-type C4-dicarboxylate transport system permease small subunit
MSITPEHLAGHAWAWTELFVLVIMFAILIALFGSTLLARWAHRDSTALPSDLRTATIELLLATLLGCAGLVWWHYGLGHPVKGIQAQHDYSLAVSGMVFIQLFALLAAIVLGVGCWRLAHRTGRSTVASVAMVALGAATLAMCFNIQV